MRFRLFVYPWDFTLTTLERQVDDIRSLGIDEMICAGFYHDARQLLPNHPLNRLVWISGGQSYLPVGSAGYPPGLAPVQAKGPVTLADVGAAAKAAGLGISGWSVCLHRDDLFRNGSNVDAPVVRNAFGDRHIPYLCPSSPVAREYLRAHIGDFAHSGIAKVAIEGYCFPTFLHGAHHESLFPPLTEYEEWLATLCFCPDCMTRAATAVDAPAVQRKVQTLLEAALAGAPRADSTDSDGLPTDPEIRAYSDSRLATVTELVQQISSLGVEISLGDQATIAGQIFRTGVAGMRPAADNGWRYGLDYARLQAAAQQVVILGYLRELAQLEAHVAAYLNQGLDPRRLGATLRPMPIDNPDDEHLRAKVGLLQEAGIQDIAFYNYSFARPVDLETVRRVIQQTS